MAGQCPCSIIVTVKVVTCICDRMVSLVNSESGITTKTVMPQGAFWLCAVDWSEIPSLRFVDVEGRNINSGANIHVWDESDKDRENREHS